MSSPFLDGEHLLHVRERLAERGTEMTPADLQDQAEQVVEKIAAFMGVPAARVVHLLKRAAFLCSEAQHLILDALDEHGVVPVPLLLEAIVQTYGPLGMTVENVRRAIDVLAESGKLVVVGEEVRRTE